MRQTLFEAITNYYSAIPRKFWLVLDIPTDERVGDDEWTVNRRNMENKILSDLGRGELEGVRGISAAKEIMTDWFVSIRNATLVLDPSELAAINDIEQVQYDDVDYLAQNNFRVLYRLFQKEGRDGNLDHEQVMMNILPYWLKELTKVDYAAGHWLSYNGYSMVADYWEKHHDDYNITGHVSASKAIVDMWKKYKTGYDANRIQQVLDDLDEETLRTVTMNALKRIGSVYSDEAEWIVHSSHLRIPLNSKLLVAVDPEVARRFDEWKADQQSGELSQSDFDFKWLNLDYRLKRYERLIQVIREYRLGDRYDLRVVDARRFNGIDLKTSRRKRDERLAVQEGEVVDLNPPLPGPAQSLADFLTDARPTRAMYAVGDVLTLDGEVGTVIGANDRSLRISFPSGERIVPRTQLGLEPAPVEYW